MYKPSKNEQLKSTREAALLRKYAIRNPGVEKGPNDKEELKATTEIAKILVGEGKLFRVTVIAKNTPNVSPDLPPRASNSRNLIWAAPKVAVSDQQSPFPKPQ